MTKVFIRAKNPYPTGGEFRVEIIQTYTEKQAGSGAPSVDFSEKKKSVKIIPSRVGFKSEEMQTKTATLNASKPQGH